MLKYGGWTFAWDGENRLISVSSNGVPVVQNQYDYMSRRIMKATATQTNTFLYDGWNLIRESIGAATPTSRSYVWGLDLSGTLQGAGGVGGLLAMLSPDSCLLTPAYDANGNITDLVDTNGAVVAHYEYDPYGNIIAQSGDQAGANPFRFSSKYWDGETEFYYYGYRFYSPELGRWLRPDPIGEIGGLNLFGFVGNCPVCSVDYLGTEFEDLGYYTVFDLFAAHGLTDANFTLEAECVPFTRRFLWWKWCRCKLKLTKFHVRVQSQIALYNAPNDYVIGSGAPIPRYADDFITSTISHEAKHRQHFGNWHDENLPQAEAEFSGTYKCKKCEEKKADLLEEWQGKWQTFWGGEANHSNPGWEGWTPSDPTYAPEDDWWEGDPPLPLDDPFDDPLGEF